MLRASSSRWASPAPSSRSSSSTASRSACSRSCRATTRTRCTSTTSTTASSSMGAAGLAALFPFGRRALRVLSFAFGFGCGLVFDEFALFWNLNPEYAQSLSLLRRGRMAALLFQLTYFRRYWARLAGARGTRSGGRADGRDPRCASPRRRRRRTCSRTFARCRSSRTSTTRRSRELATARAPQKFARGATLVSELESGRRRVRAITKGEAEVSVDATRRAAADCGQAVGRARVRRDVVADGGAALGDGDGRLRRRGARHPGRRVRPAARAPAAGRRGARARPRRIASADAERAIEALFAAEEPVTESCALGARGARRAAWAKPAARLARARVARARRRQEARPRVPHAGGLRRDADGRAPRRVPVLPLRRRAAGRTARRIHDAASRRSSARRARRS